MSNTIQVIIICAFVGGAVLAYVLFGSPQVNNDTGALPAPTKDSTVRPNTDARSKLDQVADETRTNSLNLLAQSLTNYRMLHEAEPSGFDSLVKSDGALFRAIPLTVTNPEIVSFRPTVKQAQALAKIGIHSVQVMRENGEGDATWNNVSHVAPVLADSPPWLARLSDAGIKKLGLDENTGVLYVAMGIGQNCGLVDRAIVEAPIAIPEQWGTPETIYSRFIALYELTANGETELSTARPIGVTTPSFKTLSRFDR